MRKSFLLLPVLLAAVLPQAGCTSSDMPTPPAAKSALEDGFRAPPMSARPQTWWHWMNGNVTKAGITADLEAMAEIGLGGASLFDAGCSIPAGPLKFNSPEWFDFVRHAAQEARRLGLSLCLPNCSGWSSSGGPWNPPANGMKFLDHTEVTVKGPMRLERTLPPIPDPHGFAADIAVLAVPVPPAEADTMEKHGVKVSAPARLVRELAFPEPFEASGCFFRLDYKDHWQTEGELKVETSDGGTNWTQLCTADANVARRGDSDLTLRYVPFPRTVKARRWRLSFRFWDWKSHTDFGSRVAVAEVAIGRRLSISHLYDKTLRKRMEVGRDPDCGAPDQVVAKADVRDITAAFGADGVLRWDVPAGEWRIIRLGYAANGRKNNPASEKGAGLEVDKLSATALDYHFEQYAARLAEHLGGLAGDVESGLNGILVDSYEVGCQNWTQGFEREFAARRGYSMTPYLPVLAGVVVGSVDESERFLYDFRRTVGDLFAANYSGALARKCHQYGLKLSLEPYGNCPCDDLEYGENADIPQCEFWSWFMQKGDRCVETGNAKMPSCIAHVWGKRYCAAEAFTSFPGAGGRWLTTPYALKAQGDRAFARGVNRIIFHRFAHQPWTQPPRLPGMTMGVWGMHLDRTQTWWKFGRPWMDYLARCQWMLQEGTFAADVLFWHGEEVPSRGGHLVGFPEDFADHPVPDGYDRDVCSTRALLKLRVEDGRIVAPGGVRYRLLVLQDVTEMRPEALEAVGRILDAGGRVAAPRKPSRMPGLRDYPCGDAKIRALADAVWAKGVIAGGAAEGLAALNATPDVICRRAPECLERETAWIHRVYGDGMDAYFVACPNEKAGTVTCSFRVAGREPEIWDAETGETGLPPVAWRQTDGRTEVTFNVRPSGSAFVVFRKKTAQTGGEGPAPLVTRRTVPVEGKWAVTFPVDWYTGGKATKTVSLDQPVDWTTFEDPDLKYFSGTATYRTRLAPVGAIADGARVELDMGTVKHFATVSVNGRRLRTLWKPPYRIDLTDAIRAAPNVPLDLEIRVANLWPNRLIGDDRQFAADCTWPNQPRSNIWRQGIVEIPDWVKEGRPSPTGRHTFTTWRHWTKDDKLQPSGILGPVRLLHRSAARGTLCLTFDDRNWPRWEAALPLFARYDAHASFFVCGKLDDAALESLRRLAAAGHTVGPHTFDHADAPPFFARHGGEKYWQRQLKPQMDAFARVGLHPTSMAYPNNRRSDETDAFLSGKGFRRFRAGYPGVRPYDPKQTKKDGLRPLHTVDEVFLPATAVRDTAWMRGVGIGEAYNTDLKDVSAALRRAAERNETLTFFSHDIAPNAKSINMKTEWLEQILDCAQKLGMRIVGFDELP